MRFELPDLPYKLNNLEPYISEKALAVHHDKHHLAYLENLNKLIKGTKFKEMDLETIIKVADGPIYNNAAQSWNHTFFFEALKAGNNKRLEGSFADVIKSNFGSLSFFKNNFTRSAESIFGVGWVWLVVNHKGSVEVLHMSNAGNPLRMGFIPLLACDVWEHAYYLDYQNRRTDYLEAFWKLIDWDIVERRYIEFINTSD